MKQVRAWVGLCASAAMLGGVLLAEPAVAQGDYLLGWGMNASNQAAPVPTNVIAGASSISAGYWHSLAVKDGRAWAWGQNDYLQTNVPVIAQSGVTNVAGGGVFSLALKTDGSVQAWGAGIVATNVPLSATSGVTKIAAGEWHALALKDGGVLAWGSNSHGQCTVPSSLTSGVSAISAGGFYSMALKDGGVQVFGIPAEHSDANGIRDVPAEASSGVTAISAGRWHALALKNGGVLAWGAPFYDATDVPAAATSGVSAIAAGDCFSIARKTNGTLVIWGDDTKGQLPIPAYAANGVAQIAAGVGHCLVLSSNMPPRFLGSSLPYARMDANYTNGFIYATGFPAIVYSKSGTWPSWMAIDANTGQISGMPTNEATIQFSVTISNAFGKITNSYPLDVFDVPAGPPVFVTTDPLPAGEVGLFYELQFVASNKPSFSWIAAGGGFPPGLALSTNGLLSGMPNNSYDTFFYMVASNMLGVTTQFYNLKISLPTTLPEFVTESPLPSGVVGQPYTTTIIASNNPSFSMVMNEGNLPDGLTLFSTGVISGTPTRIENPTFMVRATNNVVGESTRVFSIEIFGPPEFVTVSPLQLGVVGSAYSNQIAALGDPIFSMESGVLPSGLGLTSSGWVTGMPTIVGTSSFTVHATNDYGWSNRVYALTIEQTPVFATTNLPFGKIGMPYSQQIEASDDPTFSVSEGSLPDGLSLSGGGWLTGTPSEAGLFGFTVRASNSYGASDWAFDLMIDTFDAPWFTDRPRYTNGSLRLAWTNPNASGTVQIDRATNITVQPVVWSNFGVQLSPWTNDAPPMPAYYRLRLAP